MNILYFYPANTSFIRTDHELLKQNCLVTSFFFDGRKKWQTPWQFLRQLIFLTFNSKGKTAFVCNFAGYHSFLPVVFARLLNIPSILILAGTDCVSFPSIGYGNLSKGLLRIFTAASLKHCTHTCPVHRSLVLSDYTYTADDFPKQGYLHFVPSAQKNFSEIPYGYDPKRFYLQQGERKLNSFLTVTQSIQKPTYFRKGIDLIVAVAAQMPHCTFTVIGKDVPLDETKLPSNIRWMPPVPFEDLVHHYNQHEFYLQLSICEGFPNALCEAMLCGCIPIGSDVAAIPYIIGTTGYVLKKKDTGLLKQILSEAIAGEKGNRSLEAHLRISENFTLEKRASALAAVVKSTLHAGAV